MKFSLSTTFLSGVLVLASASALAQSTTDGDDTARSIVQRHDDIDLESVKPKDREPASRSVAFAEGLELLARNSLDIENAKLDLINASILDKEARSNFAPNVNVSARVIMNDPAVEQVTPNPLAPMKPYLDSIYQRDAGVRQDVEDYLATHADAIDARVAASRDGGTRVITHRYDYGASLTARQPIFNGHFFPARKLADLAEEQAHATVAEATFLTQEAYTQGYFQAVSLQRASDIAKTNIETARITLQRLQRSHEVGAASEVDLTRAEVTYLTAIDDYENANIAYSLAIESLATLLRIPPDFDVEDPEDLQAPESLEALLEHAFEVRPELTTVDMGVREAELRKREARSAFEPYIYAEGQANAQRTTAFTGRVVTWNVSLNLSWDLWDGGQSRRARQRADLQKESVELQRSRLLDRIQHEIRSAWLTMRSQANILRRAKSISKIAQINYAAATRSQSLGAASALEVDDAQNALFQAQLTEANAEVQYRYSVYELYRLQGNGLDLYEATQQPSQPQVQPRP